jgi:hypothetical protein
MTVSHFDQVISHFKKINGEAALDAFTPLEKLAVLKSTLDLISSTVSDYIKQSGNDYSGKKKRMNPHLHDEKKKTYFY